MKRRRKLIYLTALITLVSVLMIAAVSLRSESDDFKLVKNLDIYYSLVRELNTFYVDGINPDKLIKTSIDEMLKTLDPYTNYYSESDIDDFRFMTTGKYGGIGSLIRSDGEYAILTEIYKGFPADKAGLKAGDKLLEIDGVSLKGLTVDKVSEKLKGDPGTEITIAIKRQDTSFTTTLIREKIYINPVPYYGMLDKHTGYIRFTNFTQNCSNDVKNAFLNLKREHNAGRIILDMRNNPGGLLPEAVEIVNLFVGPGEEIVRTSGKVDKFDSVYKTSRQAIDEDIPLAVIINSNTASAAEIVAGAIQDLDRGIVVGQRSYGKGLVQISRPLSYNTTLKVTTAKYYIPSGRCIQALDFTHRNEDGSVGHIPDSLITEFRTRNGRIVKDGGGIMPDYNTERQRLSQVTSELYVRSYIFDFVTEYCLRHEKIDLPGDFSLGDDEYELFSRFLKEKEFSYQTATERSLRELLSTAQKEKYYEVNKALFDSLKHKLEHNLDNDLKVFRDEITGLIEDEIITRYYYQEGMIQHLLKDDNTVLNTLQILNNDVQYSSTLQGISGQLSDQPLSFRSGVNYNKYEDGISC